MPKSAQTTAQLHSSHTLVMFKIPQARLQQYMIRELPEVQGDFRKGRGTRDQIANIPWIIKKKQESSRKTLTMSKPLCASQQTVENSERNGNTRPPDLPLEKPVGSHS